VAAEILELVRPPTERAIAWLFASLLCKAAAAVAETGGVEEMQRGVLCMARADPDGPYDPRHLLQPTRPVSECQK